MQPLSSSEHPKKLKVQEQEHGVQTQIFLYSRNCFLKSYAWSGIQEQTLAKKNINPQQEQKSIIIRFGY